MMERFKCVCAALWGGVESAWFELTYRPGPPMTLKEAQKRTNEMYSRIAEGVYEKGPIVIRRPTPYVRHEKEA